MQTSRRRHFQLLPPLSLFHRLLQLHPGCCLWKAWHWLIMRQRQLLSRRPPLRCRHHRLHKRRRHPLLPHSRWIWPRFWPLLLQVVLRQQMWYHTCCSLLHSSAHKVLEAACLRSQASRHPSQHHLRSQAGRHRQHRLRQRQLSTRPSLPTSPMNARPLHQPCLSQALWIAPPTCATCGLCGTQGAQRLRCCRCSRLAGSNGLSCTRCG